MTLSRPLKTTLVVFLLILCLFLVINLWMVAPYLISVLMGGILATLAHPIYLRLRAFNVGPKLSAMIVTIGIVLLVIIPIVTFSTLAIRQGIEVGQRLAQEGVFDVELLLDRATEWDLLESAIGDPQEIREQVRAYAQRAGARLSAILLGLIGGIPEKLLQAALALISCFFLLMDGRIFVRWLNDKIPLERDVRTGLYSAFRDTTVSVIWATLAAAGVQALIMFLAYFVLGVPGKFLAAGATFFFAWIPLVGSTPVWVAGALALYFKGGVAKLVLMVVFGLICGLSDNLVRPLVLKGRSDIHPLVSLVAIFGAVQMFGLFGVFFGPILVAVLLALLQVWPIVSRRYGLVPENGAESQAQKSPGSTSESKV